jgi:hypothetical protein
MNTQIETVTGVFFDVANPRIQDVDERDIAWALSREPRFGSHSISEVPYTVGQHSLCVMRLVEKALYSKGDSQEFESAERYLLANRLNLAHQLLLDPTAKVEYPAQEFWNPDKNRILLASLLHDGSEAYLRDLPSPVKHIPGLREAYKSAEIKVQEVIFEHFKITDGGKNYMHFTPLWDIIHWADLYCRTIEAYHFMPSRGRNWHDSIPLSLVQLQNFEYPRKPLEIYEELLREINRLATHN